MHNTYKVSHSTAKNFIVSTSLLIQLKQHKSEMNLRHLRFHRGK